MTTSATFGFDEKVLTLGGDAAIGHATIDWPGELSPDGLAMGDIVVPEPLQALEPGGDVLLVAAPSPSLQGQSAGAGSDATGAAAQQAVTSDAGHRATHIVIDATFDTSVLDATSITASYESAVDTAIQYYENEITTPITVDIDFGWGEVGSTSIEPGALGESSTFIVGASGDYSQIYSAVTGLAHPSAIQQTAYATLPTTDPTGGSDIILSTAQAAALGLENSNEAIDAGAVGLDSSSSFFWSQSTPQAGSYDAVGVFEHEISEVLGRIDEGGNNGYYTLLDFFRYTTAANPGTPEAPGSAAGARDEPFAANYSASNYSYFSYNGQTVGLEYDTPAAVAAGDDIADWAPTAGDDSYDGVAVPGVVDTISATDLQELNVIGYSLAAACYLRGTRLRTPHGDVKVEALREGEAVLTADGRAAPVRWIGRRRYDAALVKNSPTLHPIRFRAGALGPRVPIRDLLVSPLHAMFIEGMLVPAMLLVNGVSVVQEVPRGEIEYFHVELDRHDIVLAEGAAAESFRDENSRIMFDNAGEWHGRGAGGGRCAPKVEHGFALEALRRKIDARAGIAPDDAAVPGALHGWLDACRIDGDATRIIGWARQDAPSPRPVTLRILARGKQAGRVLADRYRADLAAAGHGFGRHGFELALPRLAPGTRIEVFREADGAPLPGSPFVMPAACGSMVPQTRRSGAPKASPGPTSAGERGAIW